jgi:hypothetical protein
MDKKMMTSPSYVQIEQHKIHLFGRELQKEDSCMHKAKTLEYNPNLMILFLAGK